MKTWLEDLFYLAAFVVAIGLVTLSVYTPPACETTVAVATADRLEEPTN